MKTHVEFRSDLFPALEEEEISINPGRHGKRLADFLTRGLRGKGFQTLEPVPEDWGWMIQIENEGFNLWIGCGNYDEYPDGFLCFIEPHQPTLRKFLFWKVDTTSKVTELQLAIDELLSTTPGIREKRWWSYGEFNQPGRTIER
jgi:hypothetical protein